MKTNTEKREGFYMNINSKERDVIKTLQEDYAINISRAFKIFLKQMLDKMEKQDE